MGGKFWEKVLLADKKVYELDGDDDNDGDGERESEQDLKFLFSTRK